MAVEGKLLIAVRSVSWYKWRSASGLRLTEQYRICDNCEEMSTLRSNCTNGVVWSKVWGMRSPERKKVNDLVMKCLRSLVGVSRMDRVWNEEVTGRAGIKSELASRVDQRILRWFWHVWRMDEYHMTRRVLIAEVTGERIWGRPRFGWMDGVKVTFGSRGMSV